MSIWNENVTRVDEANHRAFLVKKFLKSWPKAPMAAIEAFIEKELGPKVFYDRGRR
jgi:hypothetical protein